MKRTLPALLSLLLFILAACSSATDPGGNNPTGCTLENDFALQTGNWWVYNAYETDLSGRKISGTERLDSTVVEGTSIMLGKTAYMLVNYSTADGGSTYTRDTSWMAVGDGRVWTLPADVSPIFCECLSEPWLTIADCGVETWTAFDTTQVESLPVRISHPDGTEGMDSSVVHHVFRVTGSAGMTSGVTVGGVTVPTHEYRTENSFILRMVWPLNVEFVDGGRTRTLENTTRFVVAKNIGVVELEKTAYRVQGGGESPLYNGTRRHLLRYSVK